MTTTKLDMPTPGAQQRQAADHILPDGWRETDRLACALKGDRTTDRQTGRVMRSIAGASTRSTGTTALPLARAERRLVFVIFSGVTRATESIGLLLVGDAVLFVRPGPGRTQWKRTKARETGRLVRLVCAAHRLRDVGGRPASNAATLFCSIIFFLAFRQLHQICIRRERPPPWHHGGELAKHPAK